MSGRLGPPGYGARLVHRLPSQVDAISSSCPPRTPGKLGDDLGGFSNDAGEIGINAASVHVLVATFGLVVLVAETACGVREEGVVLHRASRSPG